MAKFTALLLVALLGVSAIGVAQADPDALWRIISERCVPDQLANRDPAPCSSVRGSSS